MRWCCGPGIHRQASSLTVSAGLPRYGVGVAIQDDVRRLNQVATAHRDWSRRTWEDVARHRAEVQARQGQGLDPVLTGKQWYDNPYGGQPIRQSAGPAVIWINRNGEQLPSDNSAFDPRTPTDPDWQRLVPKKP